MDLNRNARRAPRPDRPARRAGGHLTGKSICDCPACKTGRDPISRMRDGGPWDAVEVRPAPVPADVPDADLAFAVRQVEPVDFSPIVIDSVPLSDGRSLSVSPPIELHPTLDGQDSQVLAVTDNGLNLFVGAPTRDELVDEILAHIAFMWAEYAQEQENKLTPTAQVLRKTLLNRMKEK